MFEKSIESIALFTHVLNEEIQTVRFYGDLMLQQKALLTTEGLYEIYNHSIVMNDYSLEELLMQNFNRKCSYYFLISLLEQLKKLRIKNILISVAAKISNEYVTKEAGYSSEEVVVIKGELIYREHLIYYQPSIWEELKWAWVQYLSCFLVFSYITKHILIFVFTNRYLNCYVVVPWKNK